MSHLYLCENTNNCKYKTTRFNGALNDRCPHSILHKILPTCKINLVGRGIGHAECSEHKCHQKLNNKET